MEPLKFYSKVGSFINQYQELLDQQYFQFYPFNTELTKFKLTRKNPELLCTIKKKDAVDLMLLQDQSNLSIYGEKWTEHDLKLLNAEISRAKTEVKNMKGQKDLAEALLHLNNLSFTPVHDRIIHHRSHQTKDLPGEGEFQMATLQDFPTIMEFGKEYLKEDFDVNLHQSDEQIVFSLQLGIRKKKIFLWKVNNEIRSMFQVVNNKKSRPLIGSLITPGEFRGKGYATLLLSAGFNYLLEKGATQVGAITKRSSGNINHILEKLEFTIVYDWVEVDINR